MSTPARQIIVVDCETNGLDVDLHQPVEVAWWNLTTDVRGRFIPGHDVHAVLGVADVKALQINGYIDRIAEAEQDRTACKARYGGELWCPVGAEGARLWRALRGNCLAGSNPSFDAAMLRKLFSRGHENDEGRDLTYKQPAVWHHRMWDLSAYAAGVLDLDELPGLAEVCRVLSVDPPDHTAEGDVTATGTCFRKLMQRAGER